MVYINDKSVSCLTANQVQELLDLAHNERVQSIKELTKLQAINPDEKLMMLADALNIKGTNSSLINWISNPNNTRKVLEKAGLNPDELDVDNATLNNYALQLVNFIRYEDEKNVKKNTSIVE